LLNLLHSVTMQITKKNLSDTKVQLKLAADTELLDGIKKQVLQELAGTTKLPGFRSGKAPLTMIEKQVDPVRLQSEFVEHAVNSLYAKALEQEGLRPVAAPEVKITKFVPFDTLEVEAEVEVVGRITLPDYKNVKLAKEKVSVDAVEVDEVIANLRTREAEKKDVTRAAKMGDQTWIDFVGTDAKTKELIKGADGTDYPLFLGSNTFIPGFEPELVGLKAGDKKEFTITFPKDYGAASLQNRKVTFAVTLKKVQEVIEPKLDDALAAKVGPFKNVAELKADIKQELTARKQDAADQKYANDLVMKVADKAKVAIPEVLITEQLDRIEQDDRQNLMYRGQTWQEFLEAEGLTGETYRAKHRSMAESRVKAGLVLSEIAEAEKLTITKKELDDNIAALKMRYPDDAMQAELAKPESRREIASRMLVEKTVTKLKAYAEK